MIIIGIDLSGPSNPKDTAYAQFRVGEGGDSLIGERFESNLKDVDLFALLRDLPEAEPVVIAIDSPLSYKDGGGGRASANALRRLIQKRGLNSPHGIGMSASSIMSPFYISSLAMRGMHIARSIDPRYTLIETHSGATLGLHMTDRLGVQPPYQVPDCILHYKQDDKLSSQTAHRARQHIVQWLEQVEHVHNLPEDIAATTHQLDSCAAAFAAWKHAMNQSVFHAPVNLPQHPYGYSC
jgi:predicted nuclease with RNAse H fold